MPSPFVRYVVLTLAAFGILATSTPVFAQGVGIGVKGGAVFASFTPGDLDLDRRTGWQAGLFLGGNRTGTVGVMGEINFIQKRASGFEINYVQLPVLLRVNIGSKSKGGVSVYGIGGPALDIKINDDVTGIDLDDAFESVDVEIIAGAGIELSRFIIEGRYTWGLRQVNKQFSEVDEIKTRAAAILFGIRFN